MRISKVGVRNFMGLRSLDIDVADVATVAEGKNKQGKTSWIKALRAALAAQGIGPDAITIGADRAEIFVDLDDITVRRVIGPNKSSVAIMRGGREKDHVIASKQAYLNDLIGAAPLDPLDLYLEKPPKRRAKILEVLPITVTLDQLRRFAPDLPDDFDVTGHGLEVLERARQHFYDQRTVANRATKDAKAAHALVEKEARAAAADVPGLTLLDVQQQLATAEGTLRDLTTREREARAAAERTQATRDRIAALRTEADAEASAAVLPDTFAEEKAKADEALASAEVSVKQARDEVAELERRLVLAREVLVAAEALQLNAKKWTETFSTRLRLRSEAEAAAAAKRQQALDLESAIGAAVVGPTAEEMQAASEKIAHLRAEIDRAALVEAGRMLRAKAAEAAEAVAKCEAIAGGLDETVRALTDEAPAELLATGNMIRGLSLEGDEVLLDGKRLDSLSGAEQLDFAIEIAKRANARAKFLIVDGLERISPSEIKRFISTATAGGWQLLATRVTDGELAFHHYAADDVADESEAAQ